MKLTGKCQTTQTGLSEGMLFDFSTNEFSRDVAAAMGLNPAHVADLVPVFGYQASVDQKAAELTGLTAGIPVSYRAGDQPNNALSLNVLQPGELAATAGTSGVIYGILDRVSHDPLSRVNVFAHVNHMRPDIRLGVLLCINGTGIQYSWLKKILGNLSYEAMNQLTAQVSAGSEQLLIYPFGNGVERIHQNRYAGAQVRNIDFNRHGREHLIRAAQEGIVYAMNYGFKAMKEMGVKTETVRAGYANLFLSEAFAGIFANVTQTRVELYNTDGATGAARGAGIGAGFFKSDGEAFSQLSIIKSIDPEPHMTSVYHDLYARWEENFSLSD